MGDIQSMFHQVQISKADCDFLRFHWWPYRMTMPLFGAVSSPGCAKFAIRRNAENQNHERHSDVISTVIRNFYAEDCLY